MKSTLKAILERDASQGATFTEVSCFSDRRDLIGLLRECKAAMEDGDPELPPFEVRDVLEKLEDLT